MQASPVGTLFTPFFCAFHRALDGHDLVSLPHHGKTINTISLCFQEVTRAQVYESLAYCEDHRGEIDVVMAAERMAKVPAPGGITPWPPNRFQPMLTYSAESLSKTTSHLKSKSISCP